MNHQKMRKNNSKKTSKIDPKNEDVSVVDESGAQNTNNTGRRLCNPTENGVRDPNLAVRTGKRFGINATGFQGINCKSAIYFNHKNNAVNFSINLCEYSLYRFKNPIIIKKVSDAINDPMLLETNVRLKLLLPEITKKEYNSLFDYKNNLDYKKLKSLCRKYKINFYKINRVRKEILIKNLYDKKLIELIQNERKLNLILDNAQIHKAEVTRIVADILNINLVYLPVYSPFLNPIEKVWADIKREFYMEYYGSVNEIIEVFEKEFYERADNTSYFEKGGIKYFDTIFW